MKVAKTVTRNLNRVIDVNFYPLEEAKRSNLRHRPIGEEGGMGGVSSSSRWPIGAEEVEERQMGGGGRL